MSKRDTMIPGLRNQYHLRPSPNGFHAWDVSRLTFLVDSNSVDLNRGEAYSGHVVIWPAGLQPR
jgi:hypothetical protein